MAVALGGVVLAHAGAAAAAIGRANTRAAAQRAPAGGCVPAPLLATCRPVLPPQQRCGLASPPATSARARAAPRRRAPRLRCAASLGTTTAQLAELPILVPGLSSLQQDAGAALIAAAGALLVVKTCDLLAQNDILDRTLTRKLVHIISGTGFLLTWLLFSNAPEARYIAALVPFANGVRLAAIGSGALRNEAAVKAISRQGDPSELLRGPLIYVAAMMFATVVFWRSSPVGVVAISLMCGGDGLADVVGRRLGKNNKLPFNPTKSYAGSAAMFLGSLAFASSTLAVFSAAGAFVVDWSRMVPALALIAAVATVVESLPFADKLDDNVTVPSVAMLMGALLL